MTCQTKASAIFQRALLLSLLLACSCVTDTAGTLELGIKSSPGDTTILVGQSFVPSVALSGCGGRKQLSDTFAWSSSDANILAVDAATGRTTGKAIGTARLSVKGKTYGAITEMAITVR